MMNDMKDLKHVDTTPRSVNLTPDQESFPSGHDNAHLLRRATLKMDLIIPPLVTMFYLMSFLDRTNIGNAKVAGFQKDLKLTNKQYSTALTITYVPYILAELPSNLLLKKLGPHRMLPTMLIFWGAISLAQGWVKTYHQLLGVRFLLGLFEGGLLPGIVLYLSMFYRRHQLQLRVAMVFSGTSLAGAFSGLVAAAFAEIEIGLGGLNKGWTWIFLIEGLFTIFFGLLSYFLMPSSPERFRLLTDSERSALIEALREDGSYTEDNEPFSWIEVFSAFKSPQVLLLAPAIFFDGVTLFGLAFFGPSIVGTFGYSQRKTQLLSVPPFACAFVASLLLSYFSDRYRARGATVLIATSIATAGYAIFLASSSRNADYAALFLQVIGAYCTAPAVSAWMPNNVLPHYKRATSIAIAFTMSNCGGILSTWIFTTPPHYRLATKINLAFSIGVGVFALLNMWYLSTVNRQRAERRAKAAMDDGAGSGKNEEDAKERKRLGDRHDSFVFTL